VSSPLHNKIEQAYAEFESQKAAVAGFDQKISAAQTTVTAKNRAVSVVVDGRGDLVEIKFPTNSYRRMAPAELGRLLVETVGTARDQAREDAAEMFRTLLPTAMSVVDMLNGPVDFDSMMQDAMDAVDEPWPGMTRPTDSEESGR